MIYKAAITVNGKAIGGSIYAFYSRGAAQKLFDLLSTLNIGVIGLVERSESPYFRPFNLSEMAIWLRLKGYTNYHTDIEGLFWRTEEEVIGRDDREDLYQEDSYFDQGGDNRFDGGRDLMDIYEQAHDMDTWD